MLFNYFLLPLRNVKKQRGYAIINTMGLAIGLAAALFIFLYVRHERTYDSYHPYAVDLSSGIEIAPGEKSAGKMRSFMLALSEADKLHRPVKL
mgnify:CR=1 FL=1